ncbi:MAG: hypothetical protein O7C75_04935 [Verrucomicrobia bacterium]|nr:hypothetical protein [Verrucomicrobiota bacterium]
MSHALSLDKFGNLYSDFVKGRRSQAKLVTQRYVSTSGGDLLQSQNTSINGLIVEELNAEGHLFSKQYDSIGRLEKSIDGRGLETDFTYKSNGQMDWVEGSYGIRTTYEYDSTTGFVKAEKQAFSMREPGITSSINSLPPFVPPYMKSRDWETVRNDRNQILPI